MEDFKCPLCGKNTNCKITHQDYNNDEVKYHCDTYNVNFILSPSVYVLGEGELTDKLFNLVLEHLLNKKYCEFKNHNYPWHFFYEPTYISTDHDEPYCINLSELLNNYPKTLSEFANRSLTNLSLFYSNYGDRILPIWENRRLFFETIGNNANSFGMPEMLADLGYLNLVDKYYYVISAEGWKKIEELRKQETAIKQAFIAMKFGEKTVAIRESFKKAIHESGYTPRLIDEKEHNNQIVPEILFEIGRSKFMVVDVTVPCYGAYYEAGYAQALGKEVIICCSQEAFNNTETRPHFDIAQKSMIIWDTEDELVERLIRRIEATVHQ